MLLLAGLVLTGAPHAIAQPAGDRQANVQPHAGQRGTLFRFAAIGFTPGESIGTWLNRPDGVIIDDADVKQLNQANALGRADWYWAAPLDAPVGTWQMVARGLDSGVEHVIPFEVQVVSPTERAANVQPHSAQGATRFSFYATGFAPGESIGVWLNQPDGAVIEPDVEDLNEANPSGRADWHWRAPIDAQPGTWRMVARGLDTGVEHVIPFEIQQPDL